MKNLIVPTLSVMFSTAGVAVGCHAYGMPDHDVAIATWVAGSVASITATAAMLLARARQRTSTRTEGASSR
ncbi:MAG TPA: hypothetical protein VG734_22120 [Lacunisphaera sp.]|nr:hypothetical protein [Lacunisphaera sp.]